MPSLCTCASFIRMTAVFPDIYMEIKYRLVNTLILPLLDYVSRAHELEIGLSSVRLSVL